jgi:hypothetical protein
MYLSIAYSNQFSASLCLLFCLVSVFSFVRLWVGQPVLTAMSFREITHNGLGIAEGGANYLPTLSLNLSLPTFGNTLLGDFYFFAFCNAKKIIKSCRFIEIILAKNKYCLTVWVLPKVGRITFRLCR